MLQQIRSRISKLRSLDLSEGMKISRRFSFFDGSRIQTMPVNRILVQSAISGENDDSVVNRTTDDRIRPNEEGHQPEPNNDQRGNVQQTQNLPRINIELEGPSRRHDQIVLEILGNKLPDRYGGFGNSQDLHQNDMSGPPSDEQNPSEENGQGRPNPDDQCNQVEIPEEMGIQGSIKPDDELPFFPVYLQTHFEVMYYFGLSPLRGNGQPGSKIQLVAFILITLLGLCHFFGQLKQFILDGAQAGNVDHYVKICYSMSSLLLQLYILKLFVLDCRLITPILQELTENGNQKLFRPSQDKYIMGPIIIAGIQLIVSIVAAIRVDWMTEGYTIADITLFRSIDARRYLSVWVKKENMTAVLQEQFNETLTPTNLLAGILGLGMYLFGHLKEYVVRDILLMAALHTQCLSEAFQKAVLKLLHEQRPSNNNLSQLKQLHKEALRMTNATDKGLGRLFTLIHVENWLACSYFLVKLLWGNFANVFFVAGFIFVPKIILAYVISAEAVIKTHATRHLIEEHYSNYGTNAFIEPGFLLFVKMLEEHPIGIGRGQFQLDETFAARFVGVVVSCFLLVADMNKETYSG